MTIVGTRPEIIKMSRVIAEFDNWRKIEDENKTQGWIHQSLLSGIRYVIIKNNNLIIKKDLAHKLSNNHSLLFKAPDENSPLILKVEFGVLTRVVKCEKFWCKGGYIKIKTHYLLSSKEY